MVSVTEICVKVEKLDDLNTVMEKVEELEKANPNPNRILNVSIEISV